MRSRRRWPDKGNLGVVRAVSGLDRYCARAAFAGCHEMAMARPVYASMRAVAGKNLQGGVHLVVYPVMAFEALDQHQPGARIHDDERARICRRGGLSAEDVHEVDRLLDAGILAHMDDNAASHERGVERDGDVVARCLRQTAQPKDIPLGKPFG